MPRITSVAQKSLAQIANDAQGLLAQTFPREETCQGTLLAAQNFTSMMLPLRAGTVVANLWGCVTAAGATPANLNKGNLGLYHKSSGAQLAVTADCSAAFQTVGFKTVAVTTPYVVPVDDVYMVGMWFDQSAANGMPTVLINAGTTSSSLVINNVTATTVMAAQAVIPVAITYTSTTVRLWMAAS